MLKRNLTTILLLLAASLAIATPLANENSTGLYVRSIEQILRLEPEEIDIGTAALIVAEEWSELVHGRKYQQILDDMAYEVQSRIAEKGLEGKYQAAQILNNYLFTELGFTAVKEADNPEDLFLHTVIDNKQGYCLSLSILYLSISERLGLPVNGVVVPGHFFVRYEKDGIRFNIETTNGGGYADDDHYRSEFNVPNSYQQSVYMQNLDKLQTLGCLFNNLGNVYIEANNIKSAKEALELAVDINPSLAESHTNLGNVYMREDRVDDAIYKYRQALDINPVNGIAYGNLGNAYAKKGWNNDAMGAYEQAIRLDPNNAEAYIGLSEIYTKIGMNSKAQLMLKEAALLKPEKAGVYIRQGDIYFEAGNYKAAIEQYKFALCADKDSAHAQFNLAMCYGQMDMSKNEISAYKKALKINPDMFAASANLGNAYLKTNEYKKAIEQYERCIEIEPDNNRVHFTLGLSYFKTKKFVDAAPHFEKVVALQPSMAEGHYNLGLTYYNLKNFQKAYKHVTTAKELGYEVSKDLLKALSKKLR